MLSPETNRRLQEARDQQDMYQPSSEVLKQLGEIAMVPLVGISGAGKSTVIDNVIRLAPDNFHFVRTRTTRERKTHEAADAMTFIPNDDEHVAQLLDRIDARELVQYAFHKETGRFYGTAPEDYDVNKTNLMPTMSGDVKAMAALGFKAFQPVVIVPDITAWRQAFQAQGYRQDERIKRLREAETSLDDSLAQRDAWLWLHNEEHAQMTVAHRFKELVEGDEIEQTDTIALAARLRDAGVRQQLRQEQDRLEP